MITEDTHGKDWECWCVEDGGIEYHLSVDNRATSLVEVSAPEWWSIKWLTDILDGTARPLFAINSPELVRLIDKANEYFDAHNEEIEPQTNARIHSIIVRELRLRGIR